MTRLGGLITELEAAGIEIKSIEYDGEKLGLEFNDADDERAEEIFDAYVEKYPEFWKFIKGEVK